MKGEIIAVETCEDDFKKEYYRAIIIFEKMPDLRLGSCEVKQ